MAEPHAHLDKAFLADFIPNPTGDLSGAIEAMHSHRHLITLDDTIDRAERAARLMLANGVTAIRTHADTTVDNGWENGLTSVLALIEVRERLRGLLDIQVCALTGWPSIGPAGADQRALLREAIAAGVDLIGGCPHLESDAAAANDNFLSMAADAGLPVDLHTDETLSPNMLALEDLARRVVSTGFPHAVTASHCVSLGVQTEQRQREIAELVATAGISVVTLPHTNLFLQGRQQQSAMPRGLTALRALTAAGVNVAAGADNLQDPFNPIGRGDPLDTAALMILAGHLLPDEAFASVAGRSRMALRLPPNDLIIGGAADLVAIPATSVRAAIAMSPGSRLVVKSGQIVAGDRSCP
jgi:cytosine deaminase